MYLTLVVTYQLERHCRAPKGKRTQYILDWKIGPTSKQSTLLKKNDWGQHLMLPQIQEAAGLGQKKS